MRNITISFSCESVPDWIYESHMQCKEVNGIRVNTIANGTLEELEDLAVQEATEADDDLYEE